MESESPPQISTPTAQDNTEVLSREAVKVAVEGNTYVAEERGESTPTETGDGGNAQFGPQPNIIPDIHMAPKSHQQASSRERDVPSPPAPSVNPEVLDTLKRFKVLPLWRSTEGVLD